MDHGPPAPRDRTAGGRPPLARNRRGPSRSCNRGGVAAYPTDSIYALGLCDRGAREPRSSGFYRAKDMKKNQRLALNLPRSVERVGVRHVSRRPRSGSRSGSSRARYTLVVPATRSVPRNADRPQAPHGRASALTQPPDRAGRSRQGLGRPAAYLERESRPVGPAEPLPRRPTRSSTRSAKHIDGRDRHRANLGRAVDGDRGSTATTSP